MIRNDVAIYTASSSSAGLYDRARRRAGGAERQMTLLARTLASRGKRVAHIVYPPKDPVDLLRRLLELLVLDEGVDLGPRRRRGSARRRHARDSRHGRDEDRDPDQPGARRHWQHSANEGTRPRRKSSPAPSQCWKA